VCIWQYILQITTTNYISKIFVHTTFHMYPLGPWSLKILMFALLVTCEIGRYSWPWEKTGDGKYMLGLLLILISKSWVCTPRARHAFLRQRHMRRGGVIYFCQGFFPCMMPSMDGWRDRWMDGWKASRKTITTSFTICNHQLRKGSYYFNILVEMIKNLNAWSKNWKIVAQVS
jgi:hypothetical protein